MRAKISSYRQIKVSKLYKKVSDTEECNVAEKQGREFAEILYVANDVDTLFSIFDFMRVAITTSPLNSNSLRTECPREFANISAWDGSDIQNLRNRIYQLYQLVSIEEICWARKHSPTFICRDIYMGAYDRVQDAAALYVASKLSDIEYVQNFFKIIIRECDLNILHAVLSDSASFVTKEDADRFWITHKKILDEVYVGIPIRKFEHLDIVRGVFRLNVAMSPSQYTQLPIVREICLMSGSEIVLPENFDVWKKILLLVGVPEKSLGKFVMLSNTSRANVLNYENITALPDVDVFLNSQLQTMNVIDQYVLTVAMAKSNQYDALTYCLQNNWHIQDFSSSNTIKSIAAAIAFLNMIISSDANLKTLVIICRTLETVDIWNSKGMRPLHHIVARRDENESVALIKWLVANGKIGNLFNDKDSIPMDSWAIKCKKILIVNYLQVDLYKTLHAEHLWYLMNTLVEDVKSSNYPLRYPPVFEINAIHGTTFANDEVLEMEAISRNPTSDAKLLEFGDILHSLNIKCINTVVTDGRILVDRRSLVEYVKEETCMGRWMTDDTKKSRKKGRRDNSVKPIVELENAGISAVGGGGKDRPDKIKIVHIDKFETKFTEADRDKVHLDHHQTKCNNLYEIYSCKRTYDTAVDLENPNDRPRMTLSEFRYRAQEILGDFFTEEIVCTVYAQEYYDPKVASAFEKSKCSSHYATFKNRSVEEVQAVAVTDSETSPQISKEESLVELVNPFKMFKVAKTILSKKAERPISVNLQAAKHEFLFLKGLFSWKHQLDKPLLIHDHIFEDCLRLGAVRFYNAILLYSREVHSGSLGEFATPISYDDSQAARIRNVLAHNFIPIAYIQEDVEKLLFRLGERVVDICNGVKISPPTITLTASTLSKIEVKVFDKMVDGTFCRLAILNALKRMKAYLDLVQSKQRLDRNSELLKVLNGDWETLSGDLKIWIHHARGIESCILQVGELSRAANKFLSPTIQNYVMLCREVRHIGYHVNVGSEGQDSDEWNFDPIAPDFLADMIEGAKGCTF